MALGQSQLYCMEKILTYDIYGAGPCLIPAVLHGENLTYDKWSWAMPNPSCI